VACSCSLLISCPHSLESLSPPQRPGELAQLTGPGKPLHFYASVLGLHGKVLVVGGYKGGFCEKLPEASTMSNRADVSRLRYGPAAGQGQAHQRRWECLWDNTVKKEKKSHITAVCGRREE